MTWGVSAVSVGTEITLFSGHQWFCRNSHSVVTENVKRRKRQETCFASSENLRLPRPRDQYCRPVLKYWTSWNLLEKLVVFNLFKMFLVFCGTDLPHLKKKKKPSACTSPEPDQSIKIPDCFVLNWEICNMLLLGPRSYFSHLSPYNYVKNLF
jgi:hypothetical protein